MPSIVAEESLQGVEISLVGSGNLKPADHKRFIGDWSRELQSGGKRTKDGKPEVVRKRSSMAEIMTFAGSSGVKVRSSSSNEAR